MPTATPAVQESKVEIFHKNAQGEFVELTSQTAQNSKGLLWTGRVITTLVVLFLLLDSVGKFLKPAPVVDGFAKVGVPPSLSVAIGAILLVCTLLYAIPRTSVLGAILLTGYLGGAVLTNLRVGNPLFSFTLAPVYFGVLVWLGLYLRDKELRQLVPFRR